MAEDTTAQDEELINPQSGDQNAQPIQSQDDQLAVSTGSGMRTSLHDQNTIFQQNNAQQNEIIQQLIEVRRQNVAQFEQRITHNEQLFQGIQAQVLANQAAATAAANGLLNAQQSYNHSEATQDRVQTSADYLVSVGITTPWLP